MKLTELQRMKTLAGIKESAEETPRDRTPMKLSRWLHWQLEGICYSLIRNIQAGEFKEVMDDRWLEDFFDETEFENKLDFAGEPELIKIHKYILSVVSNPDIRESRIKDNLKKAIVALKNFKPLKEADGSVNEVNSRDFRRDMRGELKTSYTGEQDKELRFQLTDLIEEMIDRVRGTSPVLFRETMPIADMIVDELGDFHEAIENTDDQVLKRVYSIVRDLAAEENPKVLERRLLVAINLMWPRQSGYDKR